MKGTNAHHGSQSVCVETVRVENISILRHRRAEAVVALANTRDYPRLAILEGDAMQVTTGLELRLYTVLRRIAREYQSAERLLRTGEKQWGVSGTEALEMAYENIQQEAQIAIKGVRVPKPKQQ